jgi:hypothetical protein
VTLRMKPRFRDVAGALLLVVVLVAGVVLIVSGSL